MSPLKYLAGYPPDLLAQARGLIEQGRLAESLARRYPGRHEVRTDRALYDYVGVLKNQFMRNAAPLAKVAYDHKLRVIQNALGTHTTVSRVQGGKLKAKREIRVASLFKNAPAPFLKMIVVHELAHLKEREHGKAFYALCEHMEPAYHQLEFDVRLWLTALELEGPPGPQETGLPDAS
jgi:predicted metal-dependent hydrolase